MTTYPSPGVVLDVPTNLGLRPPVPGSVPGADKAPAALREAGPHRALRDRGWREAGSVLAGRYAPDVVPGQVRNQAAVLDHAERLARRVGSLLEEGERLLLLGGDCSVLLVTALGLRQRGRFGLVHVDGHTDFRHPGNSTAGGSLAGEDLAAVTGFHLPGVSDIGGLCPYIEPEGVVQIGCRQDDEDLAGCRSVLGDVITAAEWEADADAARRRVLEVVGRPGLSGFWVHVDVDVVDPAHLPAVDSPDPGGVTPRILQDLLAQLWPLAAGATVGILDPDLDPDGRCARLVAEFVLGAVCER